MNTRALKACPFCVENLLPLLVVTLVAMLTIGLRATAKPDFDDVKVVGEQFTGGPSKRQEPFVASCGKETADQDEPCPTQEK